MPVDYSASNIQNIGVASADPSGVASATINAAKTSRMDDTGSLLVGAAGGALNLYIEGTQQQAGIDATNLQERFIETGKAADRARSTLFDISKDANAIAVERDRAGPPTQELSEAAQATLDKLSAQAAQLKDASEGGMSNETYVTRVQALTKQYTARFPGYADKIRNIVGAATGLEGADMWAAKQYVQDRFAKQAHDASANTPEKLEQKMWESISGVLGPLDYKGLMEMRITDPVQYEKQKQYHLNTASVGFATKQQKEKLDGVQANSDNAAKESLPDWLNKADVGLVETMVKNNTVQMGEVAAQYVAGVLGAGSYSVFSTSEAGKVKLETMRISQLSAVEQTEQATLREYDRWAADKGVKPSLMKDQREIISNRFAAQKLEWNDKGRIHDLLFVMGAHRDKTIQEQMQIVNNLKGWADSQGMRDYGTMYHTGGETAENLKRQFPDVYKQFVQNDSTLRDATGKLRLMQPSEKPIVDVAVSVAGQTGNQPTLESSAQNVSAYKTAKQVLVAKTDLYLNSPDFNKIVGDTQVMNTITAAVRGSATDGDNARYYRSASWKTASENLQKIPSDTLSGIKSGVAATTATTLDTLSKAKTDIETKYGVKLQFGVNSAGDIAPVTLTPLKPLTTAEKQRLTLEDPKKLDEYKNAAQYKLAMKEFTDANTPKLSNLSYIRSGITGEKLNAVSTEYALVLNGTQTYKPFFSMDADPTLLQAAGNATSNNSVPNSNTTKGQGGTEPSKKAQGNWWE
jgi:hypothetical protein